MRFANISSHGEHCPSTFLTVSFEMHQNFNSDEVQFICFFVVCGFGLISKKKSKVTEVCTCAFSSVSFVVLVLTFGFLVHFEVSHLV